MSPRLDVILASSALIDPPSRHTFGFNKPQVISGLYTTILPSCSVIRNCVAALFMFCRYQREKSTEVEISNTRWGERVLQWTENRLAVTLNLHDLLKQKGILVVKCVTTIPRVVEVVTVYIFKGTLCRNSLGTTAVISKS